MNIYGFQKSTLLDYPEHLAATIFTGSCNFCCPFCHNGGLVLHCNTLSKIPETAVIDYLKKRKNILEGVCITGGEPTLQKDLADFIYQIKELGYRVKLDTNGYNPNILQSLLDQNLLDYVAMDIKNSPQNYAKTAGLSTITFENIGSSVNILKSTAIDYEFRTTIIRELHTLDDILEIGNWLKGNSFYYLQSYKDSPDLIQQGYHAHDTKTLLQFYSSIKQFLPNTFLRGIDME